ncbi:redox-regulated ATPase YchF [bacterium]|nr:redox-regulated ATPase YchF [bacterium]
MKIGLIGLPRVGRTTVFNLLTGRGEATGGGGREAHRATIKVPDPRVDRLTAIFKPKKTTYAEIEFLDLPAFEVGRGGIPSERLSEMRNVDALVHVLRAFPGDEPGGGAAVDAAALEQELILTDLLLVERRLERLQADIAKGRRELLPEQTLLTRLQEALGDEQPLRRLPLEEAEESLVRGYQFLSKPPMVLLANCGREPDARALAGAAALAEAGGLAFLSLNAVDEWEIAQLAPEDRQAFLADIGVSEPARDRFIRACYELLALASFFTVGDDEVRAWTIERGLPAVRAAGKVHSDLERGFIRAEVIAYATFIARGSLAEARKHGELRLEGKEYPVQDGDIVNIRFNV